MTTARTVVKSAAQRAAFLPAPAPGKTVTVPLDLVAAYYELHRLEPVEYVSGVLIVQRVEVEGAKK